MRFLVLIALLYGYSAHVFAEDITVEFQEAEVEEEGSLSGIERIFQNPALQSGLASGAANINRSIDSLMEGLFYKLLDNELIFDITDSSQFKVSLNRDVFDNSDGMYVVVDRLGVGPEFKTPLSSAYGLPIYLGGSGSVNILDVYLRSDGKRHAEENQLPTWRVWANNWFGLLPILTNILPPSFNPNEMYDPVGELETPFLFPTSADKALQMPIGNLRSYSVSAVLHLGLDFLERKRINFSDKFGDDIKLELPYKIFKEGEHRINVLRKSDDIFWVGLASVDRLGHQISGKLQRVFYIFNNVVKFWKGMPAIVLPVDLELSDAKVLKYDMLFEYNFKDPEARVAFEQAVRGDFSRSEQLASEPAGSNGVEFHFTRQSKGDETRFLAGHNLFVKKGGREKFSSLSEITTKDPSGEFHVLEAKVQVEDSNWDLLVGAERSTYENRMSLRVLKEGEHYVIDHRVQDPLNLVLGFNISDRYVDALQFRQYVDQVKNFISLPFEGMPVIPLRDKIDEDSWRHSLFYENPLNMAKNISVTPTHLGTLDVDAAIFVNSQELQRLLNADDLSIAEAFCDAFDVDKKKAPKLLEASAAEHIMGELAGLVATPLNLINVRIPVADLVSEINSMISGLRKVKKADDPLEKLQAVRGLLGTRYPALLARVILILSRGELPRIATFRVKAKGGSKEIKDQFLRYDNKTFRAAFPLPEERRYDSIRDKLSKFNPKAMRESRVRPAIRAIRLGTNLGSGSDTGLVVRVDTPVKDAGNTSIFLRIEQAGKVNFGRFVLFESVVDPTLIEESEHNGEPVLSHVINLTGQNGVASGFIVDQAFELGGEFSLFIAVSHDGDLWSKDREVKFNFVDGKLLKPSRSP